ALSFTMMDRWGLTTTAPVSVNILPGAVNDARTINEDTTLNMNVLANDQFPTGQTPVVSLAGSPPPATLFTLGSNGAVIFRPVANATGVVTNPSGNFSFAYRVTTPNFSDVATVMITINPLPDPPIVNVDGKIDSFRT